MKVLVLGGGVIGCTAAYELAVDGHEVTLIERQKGPALETSYANAGEVSPGYSAPWAGPGVPFKAVKWILMNHRPLVLRPHLDWPMIGWILAMLRNCTASRYELNKGRMVRLAEYSRDCMVELRKSTGIAYDERMQGTLQLFRTQQQLDGVAKDTAILDRYKVPYQVLDRDGCITRLHEPALARVQGDKFVGGLRLPGDETGDCFKFSNRIAEMAQAKGAKLRFNEQVKSLLTDGKRLTGVVTEQGRVQADAYVVALGSHSPKLLSPLGVEIPVYPVKGYSITVPVTDARGAPESTVMDETHKIAITRLGERIRVGGTAELAGYTLRLHEARVAAHADARRRRSVPRRWRSRAQRVLVRPAADDARRHAGGWRHRDAEPVSRHRPRHARLDDGGRHGPRAGRSDRRAPAGDRYERADGGALPLRGSPA